MRGSQRIFGLPESLPHPDRRCDPTSPRTWGEVNERLSESAKSLRLSDAGANFLNRQPRRALAFGFGLLDERHNTA